MREGHDNAGAGAYLHGPVLPHDAVQVDADQQRCHARHVGQQAAGIGVLQGDWGEAEFDRQGLVRCASYLIELAVRVIQQSSSRLHRGVQTDTYLQHA